MATSNRAERLAHISKSEQLKHNKQQPHLNQLYFKQQPSSLISNQNNSLGENSIFIDRIRINSNMHSHEIKSYRYPTEQKFSEKYLKILSQSIGKNQLKVKVVPELEPRGFRAASFLSRLLDRARKSTGRVSRMHKQESTELQDGLRFQTNDTPGFIPCSKAKKTPGLFDQPGKKLKPQQFFSTQLQRMPRDMDDYLIYIGATSTEQYVFTENYSKFRGLKKKVAVQMLDPRIGYAICNVLQLIKEVFDSDDSDLTKKSEYIKQYCHLFFSLSQKIPFEALVSCSLLHNFMGRLREFFISIRVILYSTLCMQRKLFSKSKEHLTKLTNIFAMVQTAYRTIIQSVVEVQQAIGGNLDNMVNLSFQVLRNMYEVQKECQQIKSETREFTMGRMFSSKASFDVQKHLLSLSSKTSLTHFEEKLLRSESILNWKYLGIPPVPYLPPLSASGLEYTLVLDIDGTLVWYDEAKKVLRQRPGLKQFLEVLHKKYEIVAFTASTKDYADRILKDIDQKRIYFQYRIYREHIRIENQKMIKDITKLGRDLSKVLIIDDTPQLFRGSPQNGINIEPWQGNPNDEALLQLLPILVGMANHHPEDIRDFIRPNRPALGYISEKQQQSLNQLNQ